MKAINYFKTKLIDSNQKVDYKTMNSNLNDINRVFVLFCCSMVNMNLQKYTKLQNLEPMILHWATIAAVDTLHNLQFTDPHFMQVVLNLQSSLSVVKALAPRISEQFEKLVTALRERKTALLPEMNSVIDTPLP